MKSLDFSRYAFTSCVAVAMLVGCGGSQSPIGAPGATSYGAARHIAAHPAPATAKDAWSGDLLYVATGGDVYVLSYPSGKVVGRLGVAGADSLCSDKAGDVFVVGGAGQTILEYSHRGKLIQTLAVYDVPSSCSVDPTTGISRCPPMITPACISIPMRGQLEHNPFATIGSYSSACAHTIATEISFSTVQRAPERPTRS
jgi:hypothetical protein